MLLKRLVSLALAILGTGAFSAAAQEPYRFAVTEIVGLEVLQRDYGPFKEVLEQHSGLDIEFFAVAGRTAAVEAMAAGQLDFALTGPAEYVVFRARTNVEPVVGWTRPNYFSQLIVLAEGPIRTIDDLKGKKISFGAIGSTSQHLGPAQILMEAGLEYSRDYEPVFIPQNVAAEALKRGDIAAIGLAVSHIAFIHRASPGLELRVLASGPDLPNDLILAAETVPPEAVAAMRETFLNHGDELMAAVLSVGGENEIFEGGVFLPDVSDEDYDLIRSMYRAVGVFQFSEFIVD